jgi:hypothetical protein
VAVAPPAGPPKSPLPNQIGGSIGQALAGAAAGAGAGALIDQALGGNQQSSQVAQLAGGALGAVAAVAGAPVAAAVAPVAVIAYGAVRLAQDGEALRNGPREAMDAFQAALRSAEAEGGPSARAARRAELLHLNAEAYLRAMAEPRQWYSHVGTLLQDAWGAGGPPDTDQYHLRLYTARGQLLGTDRPGGVLYFEGLEWDWRTGTTAAREVPPAVSPAHAELHRETEEAQRGRLEITVRETAPRPSSSSAPATAPVVTATPAASAGTIARVEQRASLRRERP